MFPETCPYGQGYKQINEKARQPTNLALTWNGIGLKCNDPVNHTLCVRSSILERVLFLYLFKSNIRFIACLSCYGGRLIDVPTTDRFFIDGTVIWWDYLIDLIKLVLLHYTSFMACIWYSIHVKFIIKIYKIYIVHCVLCSFMTILLQFFLKLFLCENSFWYEKRHILYYFHWYKGKLCCPFTRYTRYYSEFWITCYFLFIEFHFETTISFFRIRTIFGIQTHGSEDFNISFKGN